jgi:hypothetical protein
MVVVVVVLVVVVVEVKQKSCPKTHLGGAGGEDV